MSVLVWWVVPVVSTLLTLVVVYLLGRLSRKDTTKQEIERFNRFRDALAPPAAPGLRAADARRGAH